MPISNNSLPTPELQERIKKAVIGPDVLSNQLLVIKKLLASYHSRTFFSDREKICLETWTGLEPRLLQPAVVLSQQDKTAQTIESSELPSLSTLIKNLNALSDHLNETRFVNEFKNAISKLIFFYEEFIKKWEEGDKVIRQKMLIPFARLTGESLDGYYLLERETALAILCRNLYGYERKENQFGNHAVKELHDVHYKANPVGKPVMGENIAPGTEFFWLAIYEEVADEQIIAAPTSVLKVDQVWIESIAWAVAELPALQQLQEQLKKDIQYSTCLEQVNKVLDCSIESGNYSLQKQHDLLKEMQKEFFHSAECLPKINQLLNHVRVLQKLKSEMMQGRDIETVLSSQTDLARDLITVPLPIERVVQAGQTMRGISPHQLLSLIREIDKFKKELEKKQAIEIIEKFCKENVDEFFSGIALNLQDDSTIDEIAKFIEGSPNLFSECYEFSDLGLKEGNLEKSKLKRKLSDILNINKKEDVIRAFKLLKEFPELAKGRYLADSSRPSVAKLPKLFRLMSRLFSKPLSPEKYLEKVPNLMTVFDRPQHDALFVASRIQRTGDGKTDNYIAIFEKSLRQICIDNDKAAEQSISKIKEEHYVDEKCFLDLLPIMDEPFSDQYLESFLKKSPEERLLNAMAKIYHQQERYQEMLDNDDFSNSDLFDENTNESTLDIPLYVNPEIFTHAYRILFQITSLVNQNKKITKQEIFSVLNPIVAAVYFYLRKKYSSPLDAIGELYGRGMTIEKLLGAEIDRIKVSSQDQKTTITVREALKEFDEKQSKKKETQEQPLEKSTEGFINKDLISYLNSSTTQWQALSFIAEHFPFLTSLPIDKSHLNLLLQRAIAENNANLTTLLIQVDADPNHVIENEKQKTPLLHWAIQQYPSHLNAIEALLKNEKTDSNICDELGAPALFSIDLSDEKLLELLIRNGADLECQHRGNKKTLLFRAIDEKNPEHFVTLCLHGAGTSIDPKIAFDFVCHWREQPAWREKTNQAIEILSRLNIQFGWLITKDAITSPAHEKTSPIIVEGLDTEKCRLTREAYDAVFDAAGKIKHSNKYGRHDVPFLEKQGIHLKFFPDAALMHKFVEIVARAFSANGLVPESEIFKFVHEETNDVFLVLATQHIDGVNLEDVLKFENYLKQLEELSPYQYALLLYVTLILGFEDAKINNHIFTKYFEVAGKILQQLFSIDNDLLGVVQFIKESKGEETEFALQIKSIVFCLLQVMRPLDEKGRKFFIEQPDPYTFFKRDLTKLQSMQNKLTSLFTLEEEKRFAKEHKSYIRASIAEGGIAQMYQRFSDLREVSKNDITGIDLIRRLFPYLAMLLEDAHSQCENPADIFAKIFKVYYEQSTVDHYVTKSTHDSILEKQGVDKKALISNTYGPAHMLAELEKIYRENDDIDSVCDALKRGDVKPFKALLTTNTRDRVLSKLKLVGDKILQKTVFKALTGSAVTKFQFTRCEYLDKKTLINLLRSSPGLLELDLSHCQQFKKAELIEVLQNVAIHCKAELIEILQNVAIHCPVLQRLTLNNLPALESFPKNAGKKQKKSNNGLLFFPNLQDLTMSDCSNLKSLALIAPRLERLEINNAKNLSVLNIVGEKLYFLSLSNSGSSSLLPHVRRLIAQSPNLLRNFLSNIPYKITVFDLMQFSVAHARSLIIEKNSKLLKEEKSIRLNGLPISQGLFGDLLNCNIPSIELLDARGCETGELKTLFQFVKKQSSLKTLKLIDHTKPPLHSTPQKLYEGKSISDVTIGSNGQIAIALQGNPVHVYSDINAIKTSWPTVLEGHTARVLDALFLPNGDLVTAGMDKTIRVWNVLTKECLKILVEHRSHTHSHSSPVHGLCFIGGHLISFAQDGLIKFWDINLNRCVGTHDAQTEIRSHTRLYDGRRFMLGLKSGHVQIWDGVKRRRLQNFEMHNGQPVNALTQISLHSDISAHSKQLDLFASASTDRTIKLFASDGHCLRTLTGHKGAVYDLQLLRSGSLLMSGSLDKSIKLWDVRTGKCLQTLKNHLTSVNKVKLMPDGKLFCVTDDGLYSHEYPSIDFPCESLRQLTQENTKVMRYENAIQLTNTSSSPINFEPYISVLKQHVGEKDLNITYDKDGKSVCFQSEETAKLDAIVDLLCVLRGDAIASPWKVVRRSSLVGLGRSNSGFFMRERSQTPSTVGRSRRATTTSSRDPSGRLSALAKLQRQQKQMQIGGEHRRGSDMNENKNKEEGDEIKMENR